MAVNRHVKSQRTKATEPRAVVSWPGTNEPITITLYAADGRVATLELSPTRALELAKELIEPAVQSIKIDRWAPGWPG